MMSSSSDSEEDTRMRIVRYVRTNRKDRTRTLDYVRYIPQLMKELLLDEFMFFDRFGLDPFEFDELHNIIESKMRRVKASFRDSIGTKERLAICLRFLSAGDSIQELSTHYSIPYNNVPNIIRDVCKAITKKLSPVAMPKPSRKLWERNAEDFMEIYKMPNCIAALEGKNLFVHGHKIVLLALVDARDRFIMVDVGDYRLSNFRGNVMDKSRMGRSFLNNEYHVPPDKPITENSEPLPFTILASSFFPPRPYLMTKYSRPECNANHSHRMFNNRLSRAKGTVNRALMRLRNKWGVFRGPLPLPVPTVKYVVQACCCMHNYFELRVRLPPIEYPDNDVAITFERLNVLKSLVPQDSEDIRDKFKQYFLSAEGQVPWQWQDIVG